jgi:hypothetical protein
MAPPEGLLRRSQSCFGGGTTPKRLRLICFFLLKNDFSRKTFGRAPLEEPELEPKRSPAKQALSH